MSTPWWLADEEPETILAVLRLFAKQRSFEVTGSHAAFAEALHRTGYVSAMVHARAVGADGVATVQYHSDGVRDLGESLMRSLADVSRFRR